MRRDCLFLGGSTAHPRRVSKAEKKRINCPRTHFFECDV